MLLLLLLLLVNLNRSRQRANQLSRKLDRLGVQPHPCRSDLCIDQCRSKAIQQRKRARQSMMHWWRTIFSWLLHGKSMECTVLTEPKEPVEYLAYEWMLLMILYRTPQSTTTLVSRYWLDRSTADPGSWLSWFTPRSNGVNEHAWCSSRIYWVVSEIIECVMLVKYKRTSRLLELTISLVSLSGLIAPVSDNNNKYGIRTSIVFI
jgi:hypothetical protein